MDAQQLNRQQTTLRKTDRHHSAIFGNIARNPIVNGVGGSIGVAIQIFAGRHAIMEPRIRALTETEFTGTSLLQHERRAQRREIVVGRYVTHHVGQISLIGTPAVQAEEQRASWSRITTPARILHVRDLQRLAEPPRNHLRFAPDQTGRGVWIAGIVGIAGFVLAYFTHASNIPVSASQSSQSLEGLGRWAACKRADSPTDWRNPPVEGKKKPRWREDHRGEKGERRRKGSIVGNCCGFLVGSFADISYISRRC